MHSLYARFAHDYQSVRCAPSDDSGGPPDRGDELPPDNFSARLNAGDDVEAKPTPVNFLRIMLPLEELGQRYVCFSKLSNLKGKAAHPLNESASTIEKLLNLAMRQSEAGRESYFACEVFDPASKKWTRVGKDATFFSVLRLDVDYGTGPEHADPDKGYATTQEAADAVYALCDKYGLPDPVLVDSGYGLHVYWAFLAIPPDQWFPRV